jgi:subtilase family serine protease
MSRRRRLASRPSLEGLEGRLVPSAMTPADLQAAYGLTSTPMTGAGETIALVDAYHDPYAALELSVFDREWGLPAASLTVENLGAATNTNAGWEEEEALDIETAHLAAPGAKIVLVEAKSDSLTDLMAAVNVATATPGVTVVSMSWGESDFEGEQNYDSYFDYPGVTYLAASGDDGSGTEWPSDSPYVIAVGGTSLTISPTGAVSQSAWSDSGGGVSPVEAEPSYQDVAQSTGLRTTPDVSADADPDSGLIALSVAGGGWMQVGGTSLATPIWAGIIAQADEGRVLEGKPTLNSTEAIEDLYNAPTGSFNDITTGPGATSSYDTATGLGAPNGAFVIFALIGSPADSGEAYGNGVGGDPLPTGGGITTGPTGPHHHGGGFFFVTQDAPATPAGDSGASGGRAIADVPLNVGQEAPEPYSPIIPIPDAEDSTETDSPGEGVTLPTAPAGLTTTRANTQAVSTYEAVDAALEGLARDRS